MFENRHQVTVDNTRRVIRWSLVFFSLAVLYFYPLLPLILLVLLGFGIRLVLKLLFGAL